MKKYFYGFIFGLMIGTWGWSGFFEIVDTLTGKVKTEIDDVVKENQKKNQTGRLGRPAFYAIGRHQEG